MGYLIIKLHPTGRVERSERARSWREREQLIAFSLWLQPGFAALDVAARLWRELERDRLEAGRPR